MLKKKYFFLYFIQYNFCSEIINNELKDFLSLHKEIFQEIKTNFVNFFVKKHEVNFNKQEKNILYLFYLNIFQFIITFLIYVSYTNLITYLISFVLILIKIIYNFYIIYKNNEISKILFIMNMICSCCIFVLFFLYGQISFMLSIIFFFIIEIFQIYYICDLLFNIWKEKGKTNY
jgi:hypothetical protein